VAAGSVRRGVDQPPAQVERTFEPARYVLRLWIEADAKQGSASGRGRAQLVEVVQCAIPGAFSHQPLSGALYGGGLGFFLISPPHPCREVRGDGGCGG